MDPSTLQKYFEGGCNREESLAVQQWLEAHPEEALRYMEAAWNEEPEKAMPAEMEASILAAMPAQTARKRIPMAAWWSAAAAVVVIAAGIWFTQSSPSSATKGGSNLFAINTPGKHALPDGSEIWLKDNTSITLDTVLYGKTSRSIRVEKGEVFFDVKTNADAPFEVTCGNTLTKVLGTSFSVTAGKAVQVEVSTGKISVKAGDMAAVALTPGKSISVKDNGDTTMQMVPSWAPGLWKENTIQLTDASFEELCLVLRAFYDVRLETASTHARKQLYNIKIDRTIPAADIIQVLSILNGIEYKKHNDTTYLIN